MLFQSRVLGLRSRDGVSMRSLTLTLASLLFLSGCTNSNSKKNGTALLYTVLDMFVGLGVI